MSVFFDSLKFHKAAGKESEREEAIRRGKYLERRVTRLFKGDSSYYRLNEFH